MKVRRASLLKLVRNFLIVFGICWLLIEPCALWFPNAMRWGLWGYLGLTVFSLAVAIARSWPKHSITRKLQSSDTQISIGVGDLLKQTGNVVIGFPDTFDTEVGDIIEGSSVQGQFQAQVFPERSKLDDAISVALQDVPNSLDREKVKGKNRRYSIGTVAIVEAGLSRYFLLAYSKMRNDLRVESDITQLSVALNECWNSIRTRGQHQRVHLSIMGSSLARIGLSRTLLIQFILLSFLAAEKRESLTSQLTIWVHPRDMESVDLVQLEEWLAGLTSSAV